MFHCSKFWTRVLEQSQNRTPPNEVLLFHTIHMKRLINIITQYNNTLCLIVFHQWCQYFWIILIRHLVLFIQLLLTLLQWQSQCLACPIKEFAIIGMIFQIGAALGFGCHSNMIILIHVLVKQNICTIPSTHKMNYTCFNILGAQIVLRNSIRVHCSIG